MLFRPPAIDRHALGIVSVVLVVSLAGCAGPLGGGGDAASPEPSGGTTDAGTPTDGKPGGGTTTDTGATATDGIRGPGDTLSSSFVAGWAQRLRSAGSFTAEMRGISVTASGGASGGSGGQRPVVDWTMEMDLSTGARYASGTISSGSGGSIPIQLYRPPSSDVTYTRTTFQGQSQVSQSENTVDRDDLVSAGLLDAVRLTRTGTETMDGETLQRYTAQGADAVVNQSYFDGSVSSLRMEVLVDADAGIIRVIDYEYEVASGDTTTTQSIRVRYTNIGTTSVDRPDWMSQVDN